MLARVIFPAPSFPMENAGIQNPGVGIPARATNRSSRGCPVRSAGFWRRGSISSVVSRARWHSPCAHALRTRPDQHVIPFGLHYAREAQAFELCVMGCLRTQPSSIESAQASLFPNSCWASSNVPSLSYCDIRGWERLAAARYSPLRHEAVSICAHPQRFRRRDPDPGRSPPQPSPQLLAPAKVAA
jgi:hypothetical protein